MSTRTIEIPLTVETDIAKEDSRRRVEQTLIENVGAYYEAASVWARFHYGHAACLEQSMSVKDVTFVKDDEGRFRLTFDWTFQDGCSDVCHEGDGYVEMTFSVLSDALKVNWQWPEQPSTADEL